MDDTLEDTNSHTAPATQSSTSPILDSDKDRLASLIAQATASYAIKDYFQAAEYYSQATELQAALNGEMAVENADLLYSYGKSLYFVAVKNSDVLGGEAAGAKLGPTKPGQEKRAEKTTDGQTANPPSHNEIVPEGIQRQTEEVITALVEEKTSAGTTDDKDAEEAGGDKPYFQFTGDENWDDSEEEQHVDDRSEEGEAGEEDDFANAFEVLDLARVLFVSKLDQLQSEASATIEKCKSMAVAQNPSEVRRVKERIADIHDLQAEIALEGERFPSAVADLKGALALKEELFPKESAVVAECHYKLSLALEFSSVTQARDNDGNPQGKAIVDQKARDEAATEMYRAIESCKLRVSKDEQKLSALVGEEMAPEREKLKLEIEDVNEMIEDMDLRLVELKKPPVSINDPKGTGTLDGATPLNGILGQMLGESKKEQKKRLDEASLSATDLSGLVKRKKDKSSVAEGTSAPGGTIINGNGKTSGKRKIGGMEELAEATEGAKKAKVEEAADT